MEGLILCQNLPHHLPHERPTEDVATSSHAPSLTQQPFGDTEVPLSTSENLGDVDFLDLNAAAHPEEGDAGASEVQASVSDPSVMLKAAASLLPAIPSVSGKNTAVKGLPLPSLESHAAFADGPHVSTPQGKAQLPPNPLTAGPGESAGLPERDERLSKVMSSPNHTTSNAADGLPKIPRGEGEGPDVLYGRDVVLDGIGYHGTNQVAHATRDLEGLRTGERPATSGVQDSVLDSFTRDLEAALMSEPRPSLHLRATDPDFQSHIQSDASSSETDLPLTSHSPTSARNDRATSEPPPDSSVPISPALDPSRTALAMDYAWDWGRLPPETEGSTDLHEPLRRDTMPLDLMAESGSPLHHLKGVAENPYLFVLELDGRSHTFELALSPTLADGASGQDVQSREAAFLDDRITFQRFLEEPHVVDDPALVLRYSLQCVEICHHVSEGVDHTRYSTWTSDHRVLRALAMYRRGMSSAGETFPPLPSLGDLGVETPQASGYAWAKWWRRSQNPRSPSIIGTTDATVEKANVQPEPQASQSSEKHYAKTLRLSSDQLVGLDILPGLDLATHL